MVRIYVQGNYFFFKVGDEDRDPFHRSDIIIKRASATSYRVIANNSILEPTEIEFSNIRDEDGNPYASQAAFETWYTTNTGNSIGGGNGGGVARTSVNIGTFADFAALETFSQSNLNQLHNSSTQFSVATVTGEAVYEWAGEDTPSSYSNMWIVRSNLNQLMGDIMDGTFPIGGGVGLVNSSGSETQTEVIFTKAVRVPSVTTNDGTAFIGAQGVSNAGFGIQIQNMASRQIFYPIGVELLDDGTADPFYWDLAEKTITPAVADKSETFTGTSIQFITPSTNSGIALRYEFEASDATTDVNLVIRINSHTDPTPVYDYQRANGHLFDITNGVNQLWLFDLLQGETESEIGLFFEQGVNLYVTVESTNNLSLLGQTISGQTVPSIEVQGRTATKTNVQDTQLTEEQVYDFMSQFIIQGTNMTIVKDDNTNTVTFSSTSGGSGTYAAPSVHNFRANTPARVDLNTDLNVEYQFTFEITNRLNIQSLQAVVTNGNDITMDTPTTDGTQVQNITLSGIDSTTSKTVSIKLRATDTQGTTHDSNEVDIVIQDAVPHEQTHFGFVLNTEDQTDIDFATDDIEARDQADGNWIVSGIPSTGTHRIYFAVPTADGSITSVHQGNFNITNQFTNVPNVTIGGQTYNVFLLNAGSAVNSSYNGVTLTVS